jgi:hypothetical protein
MREKIKKILREYDELDWIDDEVASETIVTVDNVYAGAKVRLRKESKYYGAPGELNDGLGEIIFYTWDDTLISTHPTTGDIFVNVLMLNSGIKTIYRVGPDEFDLVFAT